MGRQHVVIGRDDADIWPVRAQQLGLVHDRAASRRVRQIAIGKLLAGKPVGLSPTDQLQIGRPCFSRAFLDPLGHFLNFGV